MSDHLPIILRHMPLPKRRQIARILRIPLHVFILLLEVLGWEGGEEAVFTGGVFESDPVVGHFATILIPFLP